MPEVEKSEIASLEELNQSFWAWIEVVYHQREHSETRQTPLQRYQDGIARCERLTGNKLRNNFTCLTLSHLNGLVRRVAKIWAKSVKIPG
jgi:hypothetical protein